MISHTYHIGVKYSLIVLGGGGALCAMCLFCPTYWRKKNLELKLFAFIMNKAISITVYFGFTQEFFTKF